jgi:hypothetical protein
MQKAADLLLFEGKIASFKDNKVQGLGPGIRNVLFLEISYKSQNSNYQAKKTRQGWGL